MDSSPAIIRHVAAMYFSPIDLPSRDLTSFQAGILTGKLWKNCEGNHKDIQSILLRNRSKVNQRAPMYMYDNVQFIVLYIHTIISSLELPPREILTQKFVHLWL